MDHSGIQAVVIRIIQRRLNGERIVGGRIPHGAKTGNVDGIIGPSVTRFAGFRAVVGVEEGWFGGGDGFAASSGGLFAGSTAYPFTAEVGVGVVVAGGFGTAGGLGEGFWEEGG